MRRQRHVWVAMVAVLAGGCGGTIGTADFQIAPKWFFNVDVKYVSIDTDIFIKANGAKVTTLNIDPMLYSVGIGYRF